MYYYENLINTGFIPNYEDIKRRYFDDTGNKLAVLNEDKFEIRLYLTITPVMYSDEEGNFGILASVLIGIGIGLTVEFTSDLLDGNGVDHNWRDYLGSGVAGGIGGIAGGLELGMLGSTLFLW